MKTCKVCKNKFEPQYSTVQQCCSIKCSIELSKDLKDKKRSKAWKIKKKAIKASLKTKQNYEKDLQVVFNTFIRLRDQNKPCISCGNKLEGKYDAGHYYPVGSYKNLRFDEDNCFGQCVYCNQHNHGNLTEYSIMLPLRIGNEAFNNLIKRRLIPKKLTIPELILIKAEYKKKISLL
jgi:hypothetical protein